MFYEAELSFLRETLKKCRVQTAILDLGKPIDQFSDLAIHALLEERIDTTIPLRELLPPVKPATMYRVRDLFLCNYIYIPLPQLGWDAALAIGPYLLHAPQQQEILELAEKNRIPPSRHLELKRVYEAIPVVSPHNSLFAALEVFCETLWGVNGFSLEDIDQDAFTEQVLLPEAKATSPTDTVWKLRNMEMRYAYENELIDAVAMGQLHKVDLFMTNFTGYTIEQRLSDPVRNLKNYCIIMNTLLRKAAEKGGVHPVYLDQLSSSFAARIEQMEAVEACQSLMVAMFRDYCQLVRKHSMKDYSPPVQKAIACIDADLTGALSLHSLSQALNISDSYLSALFRKETGMTLTEYINRRRISHAKHLLSTTRLQVQTVAQHCGIVDVHYFSKLFKKHTGLTPKQYRQQLE